MTERQVVTTIEQEGVPWLEIVKRLAAGEVGAGPDAVREVAEALVSRERERDTYIAANRDWKNECERLKAGHQTALAQARADGRAYQAQLMNEGRVLTCAFCGTAYEPTTPTHGSPTLVEHIITCKHHPLASVVRERNELKGREGLQRDVLQQILFALFPAGPFPVEKDLVLEVRTVLAKVERLEGVERDHERILELFAEYVCDCGESVTCFGRYEMGSPAFGCDTCCGHGCEDGWCIRIPARVIEPAGPGEAH